MTSKLVIVESPAKTRTIQSFIGKDYKIIASMGHIIDLPEKQLGINIQNGHVETKYAPIPGKKKVIDELKKSIEASKEIYLATDPDREGEAIAYNISTLVGGKKYLRILFNEITKEGITEGLKSPKTLDMNLVDSQYARRILDRIVGYKISPFLWQKVKKGLSAGRVQSVALRIVCEREEKIQAFVPETYFEIFANFDMAPGIPFKLEKIGDKKLKIEKKKRSDEILSAIKKIGEFIPLAAEKAEKKVLSPLPFNTSSMQQEAAKRFNWSPKKTMMIAQILYEGVDIQGTPTGLITYMRTDSYRVSDTARNAAKDFIKSAFGKEYVSHTVKKVKKANIQDAHEAIRPVSLSNEPSKLKKFLKDDQLKLYGLIYQRFLASQMKDGLDMHNTYSVRSKEGEYLFSKTLRTVIFEGFRKVMGSGDEEEAGQADITITSSTVLTKVWDDEKHTKPLPRFNSGTLIKQLEEYGIGRPSTYASIISTLTDRRYVEVEEKAFVPTEIGKITNSVLTEGFPKIMDYEFTKNIEEELDEIEQGKVKGDELIIKYWDFLLKEIENAKENVKSVKEIFIERTGRKCPSCGNELVIRDGKYGKFIACETYPQCKYTENIATESEIKCIKCGSVTEVRAGKYGNYLKCTNPECAHNMPFSKGVICPLCGGLILEKRSKKGTIYSICINNNEEKKCSFIYFRAILPLVCKKCSHKGAYKKGKKTECIKCGYTEEIK